MGFLLLYDPHIAKLQRVAVTLQFDGSGGALGIASGTAGLAVNLQILVDHHAIVLKRHAGVLHLLAVNAHGIGKLHIVGLPLERRKAHVHDRIGLGVDAAALVVFALKSKRIKNLHLVMIHLVKTTVAAALSTRSRVEGKEKLNVQGVLRNLTLVVL